MSVSLLEGHVTDVLAGLPANHWHVCVTSPPYWQLRAYGTEPQVWQAEDGGALCAPEQHEWGGTLPSPRPQEKRTPEEFSRRSTLGEGRHRLTPANTAFALKTTQQPTSGGAFCVHCHAWRGELGQEPTPELFVLHLVQVFRAVRRVLRDDGTLFVNIAGCYFTDSGGQQGGQGAVSAKAIAANTANGPKRKGRHPVYKPLDYVDLPGLVARALQADGWLWRSDMALPKVAPMPESVSGTRWERCKVKAGRVTVAEVEQRGQQVPAGWDVGQHTHDRVAGGRYDTAAKTMQEWADCPGCPKCSPNEGYVLRRGSGRPTRAWERLLVFAKGPAYYWDCDGVREENAEGAIARFGKNPIRSMPVKYDSMDGESLAAAGARHPEWLPNGRNARDWFLWRPEPLKDEHYAAYPSSIPAFAIKAGSSERGCCPVCGAPWARVISKGEPIPDPRCWSPKGQRMYDDAAGGMVNVSPETGSTLKHVVESTTLGWRQTCGCPGVAEQAPVPCRVLDPFSGSGTTLLAANRLGRNATGVELKPAYNDLARKRIGREPLSLFAWQGQEALPSAEQAPAPLETTKQEQHPNRTVQGFNQRWKASHGPGSTEDTPEEALV